MTLASVLTAWRVAGELDHADAPATDSDLGRVEGLLGRKLPTDLAELYRAVGGGSFVGGNLSLHPALPPPGQTEALSLATAGDLLRSWNWPVPEPMVVFGDNGAGDVFGVWAPRDDIGHPIVVQVGEVFEARCLAVIGDDVASFLRGWTAYYLLLAADRDVSPVLDALQVPAALRSLHDNGSDDEFFRLLQWANPALPDPRPDPYERGLTAQDVAEHAKRLH